MSPIKNRNSGRRTGGGFDSDVKARFQPGILAGVVVSSTIWSEGNHGRMFANGVGATGSAFNNGAGVRAVMHANSAVSTFSLDPEA
jgi:hypothetical protein